MAHTAARRVVNSLRHSSELTIIFFILGELFLEKDCTYTGGKVPIIRDFDSPNSVWASYTRLYANLSTMSNNFPMDLHEMMRMSPYHRWLGVELVRAEEGDVEVR